MLNSQGQHLNVHDAVPADRKLYVYLETPHERAIPGNLTTLFENEHLLVIDKPHFLATMPRGKHLTETVVTKLRLLGYDDIAPLHRLDRLTAGVLALSKRPSERGTYQKLFQEQQITKTYLALAPSSALEIPHVIKSHLKKKQDSLQVTCFPQLQPNAITEIHQETKLGDGLSIYTVRPLTGKFHQIRAHFSALDLPLKNDPFYPEVLPMQEDDFSKPLGLVAKTLEFTDPITGENYHFVSNYHVTKNS
ncbi:MAG: pseudouridine synthase [Micrococcaceae bacterium]